MRHGAGEVKLSQVYPLASVSAALALLPNPRQPGYVTAHAPHAGGDMLSDPLIQHLLPWAPQPGLKSLCLWALTPDMTVWGRGLFPLGKLPRVWSGDGLGSTDGSLGIRRLCRRELLVPGGGEQFSTYKSILETTHTTCLAQIWALGTSQSRSLVPRG